MAGFAMRFVRRILTGVTALGGDGEELARQLGLGAGALDDPDGRLPLAQLPLLWQEAERRTGEGAFGVRIVELGRSLPPDHVLGYTAFASPTLRDAYRCVSRYVHVVDEGAALQVEERGTGDHLRWRGRALEGGASRHGVEHSVALLCEIGFRAADGFRPKEVRFRHGPPVSSAVHERFFCAPVRFQQPETEVILDKGQLDQPLRSANPALRALLEQHLQALVQEPPRGDGLLERVRVAIGAELREGTPTVDAVAARLRCSARTLHRRLREEGTSFQLLLDGLRHECAARHLAEGRLSIGEIAFLLGYSEVSAFHRAFRKWTGRAPAEFRRERAPARPAGP